PTNLLIRGVLVHHRCTMRRDGRTPFDHLIFSRYQVPFSHHHVRKRPIHHATDFLEARKPRGQRLSEMVRKVWGKQVIDPINVMLIFECLCKLSHYLFVFFNHVNSLPRVHVRPPQETMSISSRIWRPGASSATSSSAGLLSVWWR